MDQPDYNDPPERSVFVKPRRWRLSEPGAPEDRAPYPRWVTIPTRAALAGFEIYVLVYIAWYHQQSQAQDESSNAGTVLGGVGLAVALNLLIALLSLAGGYEAGASGCAAFLDVIPAVVCVMGAMSVFWRETRPEDPLRDSRQTACSLVIVVLSVIYPTLKLDFGLWRGQHRTTTMSRSQLTMVRSALHFTASLGGCIGCCITCGRMSAAKKAKKAAASERAHALAATAAPSDTEPHVGARESQQEEGIKGTGGTDGFHIDKPDTTKEGKGGYPAETVEGV